MDVLTVPIVAAYALVIAGATDAIKSATGLDGWSLRLISWGLGIGALAFLRASGAVEFDWAWLVPYGISLGAGTNAVYKAGKAVATR